MDCLPFYIGMICLFVVWYIYDGYLHLLNILVFFRGLDKQSRLGQHATEPMLTVLITVFNEEGEIKDRIENVLEADYPDGKIEILVASDGSTDRTDEIVKNLGDPRVRLFRPPNRFGKTDTQNQAIQQAWGDIIVFTDAGTRFEKNFLSSIVLPFSDAQVAAVDGHLVFVKSPSDLSSSQNYYWSFELRLRELESRLGILAVASGACLAVRKSLFRQMDTSIGEDCIVPLDVVLQNSKVVHASTALAYDRMDNSPEREFRTRVRMTLRNWQGTWSRPELLNPFHNLGVAWALWSHKILRWLSPFFLIGLFISANIAAYSSENFLKLPLAVAVDGFYTLALIGWLTNYQTISIPGSGTAYNFMLANAGFLVGVIRALIGQKIHAYRSTK